MTAYCPICQAVPTRYGVLYHCQGCPRGSVALDFPITADDARIYRTIGA